MLLPTKDQVNAAGRHVITAAGMAITIFGLQAKGVTLEGVTTFINSLGETINTIVQFLGAAGIFYAAIKAGHAVAPTSQIAAVQAIATGPKDEVQKSAKDALVAATISLPQVQTIVTDAETANDAVSPDVVQAK